MDINKRLERVLDVLKSGNYIYNEADFAKKTGISKSFLSDMKAGRKEISERNVLNFTRVFDVISPDWLLTGKGEMLKPTEVPPSETTRGSANRKKIPLYDTYSVGGTSMVAPNDPVMAPTEWIDAGDWFIDATAAMHHYGDSMIEYPSGCILALKEISDKKLIIWGKNYVIETDEYRITKRLQRSKDPKYVIAYSTNEEKYQDGTLIHQPIDIPKSAIRRLALVLGYVVKEHCSARFYSINRG